MVPTMNGLVKGGAVLMLLGLLGFAIPIFTTDRTTDVARLGDLKLQTTQSTTHVVPPLLSGVALLIGALMVGVGFVRKT